MDSLLKIQAKIRGSNYRSNNVGVLKAQCRVFGEATLLPPLVLPVLAFKNVFTGLSVAGSRLLGASAQPCTKAVFKTGAGVEADKLLGVIRWGYFEPEDQLLESFVECGWDTLRSGGKAISVENKPPGARMAVIVRWNFTGVPYVLTYQSP